MNLTERTEENFNASIQTKKMALPLLAEPIAEAAELIVCRLLDGAKVLCCGSGAGALHAQHFAMMMLNRFERERPGLPALALSAGSATLTSIADDYSLDEMFAKQITALAHPGDLLLAITGDGRGDSIGGAVEAAHERDMFVLALTGNGTGRLEGLLRETDIHLPAPSESAARVQELHLLSLFCICDLIDRQLLGN
ncbi:MAG: SIS domain-containing protein [gamma proteobacterium symbiont of Phacoides pectinatus]